MELILVRHAEPVRIVDADGPADPPLAERGAAQAKALAAYLGTEAIDAVWSSPMLRARETAAPLADALGVEVVVDTELAEWDREATSYVPIEELKAAKDERWVAMVEGNLEGDGIDLDAFRRGVIAAMDHIVTGNPGASRRRRVPRRRDQHVPGPHPRHRPAAVVRAEVHVDPPRARIAAR
jgi:2,3-bisphosphoglycerate-dependent phosphoglycerate mutase